MAGGADVTVALANRIADYAARGTVVPGFAATRYRRQAVAVAIPVFVLFFYSSEKKQNKRAKKEVSVFVD